jgi:epimerase transport system membrane fusion protein
MDQSITVVAGESVRQGRRLARCGLLIVAGALLPIGAWITLAPLAMAVVAPAFVKVDLNRRPVQHLEGGIVRSVLVRDGQRVVAGQPVLILGDVGVDADRNRLAYRAMVERAGLVRLEGEQLRTRRLLFPPELLAAAAQDTRVRQALDNEAALFASRSGSLDSEVALMQTQRARIEEEAVALRAQIAQVEHSLALQRKDLASNRDLLKDSFISPARVSQLEASAADYAARLEERRGELARVGQRMADVDLRIRSTRNAFAQAASDQFKLGMARLSEIEQEMRKTQDAASRQVVVAPAGGEVIDLKFTSPGAVIKPGDSIAEIVPGDARLMLEAHIRPEEINHVHLGQPARIQFTALRYRGGAMVAGKVSYISADRFVDRATGQSFFNVLVEAEPASLKSAGELKLSAGMPAQVYIEGSRQTPLEYLMEPIATGVRKAARQL